MRKHNLTVSVLLFISFLSPVMAMAQGTLTGTVTSNGQPVEHISVSLSKGGGTTTDKDGKYTLHLAAGTHSVTFSSVGFYRSNDIS